ncbi:hypothetical protein [Ralstonia pseudosolanacearum]|uniref:hypothetical protein n=1 Tax=Ralstonia pseudosolanacearum TaxID=1310165 RepID=UPI0011608C21|nr:hypothetical protein [Ralstonia pseudosolanacearum]QWF61556.1 hypothetical protein KM864_02835 [Ralstonia solanacearum]
MQFVQHAPRITEDADVRVVRAFVYEEGLQGGLEITQVKPSASSAMAFTRRMNTLPGLFKMTSVKVPATKQRLARAPYE